MSGPNPASPRFQLVRRQASALVEVAASYGARGLELCGSVARGTDHDASDIDLWVGELQRGPDVRATTLALEHAIKELLDGFKVDIGGNGSPLWLPPGDPPPGLRHYRDGALPLSGLASAWTRRDQESG